MEFKQLIIENFLSFASAKLDISKQGIFLITGDVKGQEGFDSNGAGKSSLFEALVWVLFGNTIRGEGKDSIVKDGNGDCKVSIEFVVGGNKYKVVRYRKHKKYGNDLELSCYKKDCWNNVSGNSIVTTQSKINNLLGLDFKSFINSILFGQDTLNKFSLVSDKERKHILEDILGLDYIPVAYKRAKDNVSMLSRELGKLEIERKYLIDSVKVAEFDNCRRVDEWKLNRYNSVIKILEHMIKLDGRFNELLEEVIPFNPIADIKRCKENIKELNRKVNDVEIALKGCNFKSKLGMVLGEINGLNRINNKLESDIDKARNSIGVKCDKCGSIILKKTVDKFILETSKEIDKNVDNIKILSNRVKKLTKSVELEDNLEKELKILRGKLDNEKDDLSQLQINKARRDVAVKNMSVVNFDYNRDILELSKIMSCKLSEDDNYRLKTLNVKFCAVEERILELENKLEYHEFWKGAFSDRGLKSMIFDSITPFLNVEANKFSEILTGGNVIIEFDTEQTLKGGEVVDKFDVLCYKKDGGNQYKLISGGEKKRADICQSLALRELVVSRGGVRGINLLVLDEVFESLDASGIEKVGDLLDHLNISNNSLYIITHIPYFKDKFDEEIVVVNENGESRIE